MTTKCLNIGINNKLFTTKAFRNKIIHITFSENEKQNRHFLFSSFLYLIDKTQFTDNMRIHLFRDNHLRRLVVDIIHIGNVLDANYDLEQ